MREFPGISDYNKAVENRYYPDNYLKFNPVYKENGELHFEPGGRAVVYKVQHGVTSVNAIKLFTVNKDNLFHKYVQLSSFIENVNSEYFVGFKFFKRIIYCPNINSDDSDNYFPGLLMDWAEGITLGSLVKKLCEQNSKLDLSKLADKFKELSVFIIESDFAHGDLKHDNIIVDSLFDLKLIDYDDMYIPEFSSNKSLELGTPSFQHPKRKNTDFNSHIDDFSIMSIYTSLLVLAKYPNLYEQFEDQQNLLFRSEDFDDPDNSELFEFIEKDIELIKYSLMLKKSLASDSIYIASLIDCLNGVFPKPDLKIFHYPERFVEGVEIELFWEAGSQDDVYFQDIKVDSKGSLKTKSYSSLDFRVKNCFNEVKFQYNVEALPIPEIKVFQAKDRNIEFGEDTKLFWDVENVSKVELHWLGNMEVVNQKGEKKIPALEHTTFKIVVTALDGISKEDKEVTVYVFKRIEIKSFVSDLEFALESLPIKLKWEIENATNITLCSNTESDLDVSGTNEVEIYLKKTSTLFLKANNDLFSSESDSLKIEVQHIPTFSPSIIPRLPAGNELIPTFNLAFKEISDNVLSDSQLRFQNVMKRKRRFSLYDSLCFLLNLKKS